MSQHAYDILGELPPKGHTVQATRQSGLSIVILKFTTKTQAQEAAW